MSILEKNKIKENKIGKYKYLQLKCDKHFIFKILKELEINNYFGIKIIRKDKQYDITAWHGKEAPCYDTGRTAYYNGLCIAVLDDDNHFITKSIRVCEKTGSIYSLTAYNDFLNVTDADPELLSKLDNEPVSFDCDTLEEDAEFVFNTIEYEEEKREKSVIYNGPFKMIILKNGSILRRGIPASISAQQAEELEKNDNVNILKISAPTAKNYFKLYKEYGPIFLIAENIEKANLHLPNLDSLTNASDSIKKRIIKMIDKNHDYFMIQGSDPTEPNSCCPHPDVLEAKKLINAGILDMWGAPTANSCPINSFALIGEIIIKDNLKPIFIKNDFLREILKNYLS